MKHKPHLLEDTSRRIGVRLQVGDWVTGKHGLYHYRGRVRIRAGRPAIMARRGFYAVWCACTDGRTRALTEVRLTDDPDQLTMALTLTVRGAV